MMLALEMFRSLPRTAAGKAMGGRMPGLLSRLRRPAAAGHHRRAAGPTGRAGRGSAPGCPGICGSDLGALSGKTSLYFSAVVSLPFVPGHEIVAELARRLRGPAGRHPRGRRPGAHLRRPRRRAVRRLRDRRHQPVHPDHRRPPRARPADRLLPGHRRRLGPGLAAHRSQLHVVPEGYSDEQALLIEPVACAVHTALRRRRPRERPGAGQRRRLGRACSPRWRCASSPRPARSSWSPSTATSASSRSSSARPRWSRRTRCCAGYAASTGAFQLKPEFSAPYLLGGVDVAVDAVGSKQSLETALHATRAGGRVVLSGMPAPRRPLGRVVPRAGGRRHLRLGATRARRPTAVRPSRSPPSWSPHDAVARIAKSVGQLSAAPLAGGPRPRPLGRPPRHRQGRLRPRGG